MSRTPQLVSRTQPLPIDRELPRITAALRSSGCCVLVAETGAGKTTRVPPFLLAEGVAGSGRILLLEPRRIAARAAARRIAEEWEFGLGREVGFQVRFERRASQETRILAVTEGILLRLLQADPFLEGTSLVIFDEFHERRLDSDLALAMVERIRRDARPDLRLLVMSATLDPVPVARFLDDAPVVTSRGRLYPVEISYLEPPEKASLAEAAAIGIRQALDLCTGDLLVFLPGVGEIRRVGEELESEARRRGLLIVPLFGDLPSRDQDQALRPASQRKVVLATNVAESSITVEGVEVVVDSGYARILSYDPSCGMDRLELARISASSAEQRAGRAGRQGPGFCLRLWPEHVQRGLTARDLPEIRRADLAGAVLQLMAWGESNLETFPWFEAPPTPSLERARALLRQLGAIDTHGVTDLGHRLVRLPAHPRLGRLLLAAHSLGCLEEGALLAALLSERPPFRRGDREGRENVKVSNSDLANQVEILAAFEAGQGVPEGLLRGPARHVLRVRDQLLSAARGALGKAKEEAEDRRTALRRALLAAYPDRLARRREPGESRAVMVGGRGVSLARESSVKTAPLFLCVDLDAGRRGERSEGLVRLASAVEPAWLPVDQLKTSVEVEVETTRRRVVGRKLTRFHGLVIEESECPAPQEDASSALAMAAATALEEALPLEEEDVASFLVRLRCLRQWWPELQLPELGRQELLALLPNLCVGKRSFAELRRLPLLEILKGSFSYEQLETVDREAPEWLEVPSGSRIRLRYEFGEPPILAVRIQELFGLRETPRLAGGRVSVLLHLLAPNQRPQQVTTDLASFWQNTYPQVRKELQGRYPKHAWPVDPFAAAPERRPRRAR